MKRIHKKHQYGLSWISDNRDLCYVNIPKCASSSIKSALRGKGFKETTKIYKQALAFTVIREPYSRYISGLLEYFQQRQLEDDLVAQLKKLKKIEVLDEHTEKQISFLLPFFSQLEWIIPMSNLVLLKEFDIHLPDEYYNQKPRDKIKLVEENLPFSRKAVIDFYWEDQYLYENSMDEVEYPDKKFIIRSYGI